MKLISAAAAVLAMLLTLGPAVAAWQPEQLSAFMADCIKSCQNDNPSVSQSKRGRCPDYCRCVADAGQRRFSAAEYTEMNEDAIADRDTAKLRQFKAMFQPCMRGTIQ